jgi:hypothetical protein
MAKNAIKLLITLEFIELFGGAGSDGPDALWPGDHNFVGRKCG